MTRIRDPYRMHRIVRCIVFVYVVLLIVYMVARMRGATPLPHP
jgi:hypothetical protein